MSDFSIADRRPVVGTERVVFLSVLFLITIGTLVSYPLIGGVLEPVDYQNHAIILLLGWFSTAHVGVTGFYYADKDFIPHIMARKGRYIYAPAVAITISIAAWGLTKGTAYFWIFWQTYHAWLLWHFMRQNIGVSALSVQATQATRLSQMERYAITMVGVGAIVAATRFGSGMPAGTPHSLLFGLGLAIYLSGLSLGLIQIGKRLLAGRNEVVSCAFILASLLFFAPTFIGTDYFSAVMAYAVAHALQYWLLMSLIAIGSGRMQGWVRSIGAFAVMVGVMWTFIWLTRQGALWNTWAAWVAGMGIGLTIAHFIVDADSWRMREPFQRGYVMQRLGRYLQA